MHAGHNGAQTDKLHFRQAVKLGDKQHMQQHKYTSLHEIDLYQQQLVGRPYSLAHR